MRTLCCTGNQKPYQYLLVRGLIMVMAFIGLIVMGELGQILARVLIDGSTQQVEWRQVTEVQTPCFESLGESSVNKHWMMESVTVEAQR